MNLMHINIKIKYVNEGYLPNWPYHLISEEEMFDAFMHDVEIDRSKCRYVKEYILVQYKPINWKNTYMQYYIKVGEDNYVYNTNPSWDEVSLQGVYRVSGRYEGCVLKSGKGYFFDNYPLFDDLDNLMQEYCDLIDVIQYFIKLYLQQLEDTGEPADLPSWIYTYMIGEVIGINSNVEDIHDLIKPLGVDNIDDVFTSCASQRCFNVSKNWVSKQNHSSFSGRMVCLTGKFEYGTPAQIESLIRDNSIQYTYAFVNSVDYVVIGETKENVSSHIIDLARTYGVPVIYESEFLAQLDRLLVPVTNGVARRQITVRPPTMFGEPHVIKAIRLLESNPNSQWGTYPYQE